MKTLNGHFSRRSRLTFLPTLSCRLPGDLRPSLWRHGLGPRRATFLAHRGRSRVFAQFLQRRLAVLDLASGDVDHQLGELGGIARALQGLVWHGATMPRLASQRQRHSGTATIKVAHYPAKAELARQARHG